MKKLFKKNVAINSLIRGWIVLMLWGCLITPVMATVPLKLSLDAMFSGISNGTSNITVELRETNQFGRLHFTTTQSVPVVNGEVVLDMSSGVSVADYRHSNLVYVIRVAGVAGSVTLPLRSVPYALVAGSSEQIQGIDVSTTQPIKNQILKFNGSQWVPDSDSTGSMPGSEYVTQNYSQAVTLNRVHFSGAVTGLGTLATANQITNSNVATGAAIEWAKVSKTGSKINDLSDVDVTGATNNQVLKYDGATWKPQADNAGGITNDSVETKHIKSGTILDSDISIGANIQVSKLYGLGSLATANQITNSNVASGAAIEWAKVSKTGSKINDLSDVDVTGATNNQVLKYDGATWKPQADNAGGITNDSVETQHIKAGTIVDSDISATANIAWSKLTSQGNIVITSTGNITLRSDKIIFEDSTKSYSLIYERGQLTNQDGHVISSIPRSTLMASYLSDRSAKTDLQSIDQQAILEKIATELPIYSWSYKTDPKQARHIGPMAQDLYAIFNYGGDDKSIAASDGIGLSLVAVQALYELYRQTQADLQLAQERLRHLENQLLNVSKGERDEAR